MKKLLTLALLLFPALASAQWDRSLSLRAQSGPLNGGLALPAGYFVIKDDGAALGQESILNFISGTSMTITCVDNPGSDQTDCTFDASGGGGGAPTDATYITQTPDATLSAEQALSALSTGIMRVATTTGVITSLTTSAGIFANVSDESGSGALLGGTTPTIATPNITGVATWQDGVTQVFNPDGTNAGLNVGSQAGNPSSADPGDIWYDTSKGGDLRTSLGGANTSIRPNTLKYARASDEFFCGPNSVGSTVLGSCIGLTALLAGTSAGTAGPTGGEAGHPGVAQITAVAAGGTSNAIMTSSGSTAVFLEANARGAWVVKTPATYSDDSETYITLIGSCDCTATNTGSDGVFFYYTNDTANTTPNWQINVKGGGSGGLVSTGVTFTADTWYTLEWWYESGVGVHFYINGTETSGSPINTNLPDTTGETFKPFFAKIQNTVGTANAESIYIDYAEYAVPTPNR